MALWELTKDELTPVERTSFQDSAVWERRDLQRLLRDQIEVLHAGLMVVAEEFSNWVHSDLRIDLLCIDQEANLVVIELKRDDRGGHSELQAIRYAAMAAPATFEQIVEAHRAYTVRRHREDLTYPEFDSDEARQALLEFLGWEEPDDELFGNDVRIILASTDFSIPLTSAVLWLRTRGGIDIRCIRLVPYAMASESGRRLLVDVQQLVPLPEAADLTDRMADKEERKREARAASSSRDTRRFNLVVSGRTYPRLPKRRLAYEVVRAAIVDCDLAPDRVLSESAEGRRRNGIFRSFEGRLSEAEVAQALAGLGQEPRRFYTASDDLIHVEGWTWVLTKQWGEETEGFVADIQALVPQLEMSYEADEE